MIYISIPVHEKLDVIVDQMLNFERFFPSAKVVLHLSKNANFSIQKLTDYLIKYDVTNAIVNPEQVETVWGSIIHAHLSNIRYILSLGNANKVIFHSSNDMLIMDGVEEYVRNNGNIFHLRKCQVNSYWWVARRVCTDKKINHYFNGTLYASQIEGSMYHIGVLKKLIYEIDSRKLQLASDLFYPREEIIFSSFAYKEKIKPDGLPYIYSEVHQFDRKLFGYIERYKWLLSTSSIISKGLRRLLSSLLEKLDFYRINQQFILQIRDRNIKLEQYSLLNDGIDLRWNIFDRNTLFGVKRVERDLNNQVRQFIRNELL